MTIDVSTYSASGIQDPAGDAEEITPANTDLQAYTRSIYVGGAGNLDVIMAKEHAGGGTTVVTFPAVPAGSTLNIRAAQIRTTTTATLIVALF
jgi:hypothetical protein